ncbi:MAG: maltose alpha-D-glucosyltransferase [Planctomycetia bacterium]|nr:maltose alpha-D-glucosyltransferase [Planctomycetia bacterium]
MNSPHSPGASWFRDLVIYEVYVRAFRDSNGDGIGDLKGLTEKIGYIRDLGVGAVWLLPIFPSPRRDDGYDISDYRGIHPDLGTMDDFRELLDRAHAAGLRVLTDLVLNHTSDQHRWFQSARYGPGHPFHDYYVWSPNPGRYRDARIIFPDFEPSNWTFEPLCNLYYWHRFYHHQPDLNYDNPEVRREMLDVARFWLDMGVDGFRVDAAPYLFEREGTPCEGLPETHAFLRELRGLCDRYQPARLLIAEANQRPSELVKYFGAGDEFHMAFDFPLMPRLFQAVRAEKAQPLEEVLRARPALPAGCQWAMFLRNHDELTLETVSEETRKFLWDELAQDPRARLNMGIRRRLWPLMNGGRRQIELLHGLILSLPGCAVLYYGDEIEMGDDLSLGDRDGVRTAMQWTMGVNAGFSAAPAEKLAVPVVHDAEYHYAGRNVQSFDRRPTSFLNWLRRMVKVHSVDPIFAGGGMRLVPCAHPSILAFTRELGDAAMLCVFNLSRYVQPAVLDLTPWKGRVPVEEIGKAWFPQIGEAPYLFTMGPHSFIWCRLESV